MKNMMPPTSLPEQRSANSLALRRLAWFRYNLRRFFRFSERATRAYGLTPQQYLLLLGIAGYTGRGWATISELAEFLQERHNAVVGLVQRAGQKGLVRKAQRGRDRRFVRVQVTPKGAKTLHKLASLHLEELKRIQLDIGHALKAKPQFIKPAEGA
jgi:DNA-binding MarR family transcriptional regulator